MSTLPCVLLWNKAEVLFAKGKPGRLSLPEASLGACIFEVSSQGEIREKATELECHPLIM
jgi:hypothetical protein